MTVEISCCMYRSRSLPRPCTHCRPSFFVVTTYKSASKLRTKIVTF